MTLVCLSHYVIPADGLGLGQIAVTAARAGRADSTGGPGAEPCSRMRQLAGGSANAVLRGLGSGNEAAGSRRRLQVAASRQGPRPQER